jgi:tripartite-type tricarboxylate transporter receptor subunit TctC
MVSGKDAASAEAACSNDQSEEAGMTYGSHRRRFITVAGALPLAAIVATGAFLASASIFGHAQSTVAYPERPIRIIVPFAPGGATDVLARTVAQSLGERLNQTVIVENRPGANGNLGAMAVARAEPDGYTLLMATSSHAVNATLYRKLDYSLTRDFAGLSQVASVPLMLVVHPGVPAKTARELADHAVASAGRLNYASGGTGTAAHLSGAQFATLVGAQMTHVPYKGGAQALQDLVGGQVQLMFGNLPEVLPHVQAGRLRAIALTGDSRQPVLPDVPTFKEAGYPAIQAQSWFGLFAPAAVPKAVIEKLSGEIADSVASPEVQQRLKGMGAQPIGSRHAEFHPFVAAEVERWGELVRRSGATVD